MDATQITAAYRAGKALENILRLYRECPMDSVSRDGQNLLHIAVRHAHQEAVGYLLEAGFDPNATCGGVPPLAALAQISGASGYRPGVGEIYQTACLLLEAGANSQQADEQGLLCYHHGARCGNYEFLQALFDQCAILTRPDGQGNTGLHLAADSASQPARELELAAKALEGKRQESAPSEALTELEGRVSMAEEALDRYFQVAKIFLDAGVDPEKKNKLGETAHTLAVRSREEKISSLLDGNYSMEEGGTALEARIATGDMTLHQAVRQHDVEAIRTIAALGADLNEVSDNVDFRGLTPLMTACQTCDVDTARLLLELGADLLQKSGDGRVAVAYLFTDMINIHAPQNLYRDQLPRKMVWLMANAGWDLNCGVNSLEETLVGLACHSEDGDGKGEISVKYMVVDEAIALGADVNIANQLGQTPLMQACAGDFSCAVPLARRLLEAGADPSKKDAKGATALHYAARNPSLQTAAALLETLMPLDAVDVSAVDHQGKTALDHASQRGSDDLVRLLAGQ